MSSLTGIDAAVLAFDASQSTLAIATGDGRIRLFNVTQQRLSADITQELSVASGGQVATEVYTCMAWGSKVRTQIINTNFLQSYSDGGADYFLYFTVY